MEFIISADYKRRLIIDGSTKVKTARGKGDFDAEEISEMPSCLLKEHLIP